MTVFTVPVSAETAEVLSRIADDKGVTTEVLLVEMTDNMVRQFEAYEVYRDMAGKGRTEIEDALSFLARPDVI